MRFWLTFVLTAAALPAFAADPPVKGEVTKAQAYCAHKSRVISQRVFTYSRAQSDAAGRKKFSEYEQEAMLENSEATVEALRWLEDNATEVNKAISKVRRNGKQGAESLANEIAIGALEGCQSARIAHIRRTKGVEDETSTARTDE